MSGVTCLFNVTKLCNLRCSHCYMAAGVRRPDELGWNDLMDSFKILSYYYNVKTIILLGGEPMLKPGILDIIYVASKMFDEVHVQTNSTIMPPNTIDFLKNPNGEGVPLSNVIFNLSLDGASKKENDAIRGQGHFEQAIILAKKLRSEGIKTLIRSTLFKDSDYKTLIKISQKIDVPIVFIRFLQQGKGKNLDKMPGKEKIKEIYDYIKDDPKVQMIDSPYYIYDINLLSRFKRLFKDKGICPALRKERIQVLSNGDIFPCNMLIEEPYKLGNVLKNKPEEVWNNYDKFVQSVNSLEFNEKCSQCSYSDYCNGGCAFLSLKNQKKGDVSCPVETK